MWRIALAAVPVVILAWSAAAAQVASERDLAEVRRRIDTLSQQVAARTRERDSVVAELARAETALADAQLERRAVRERQTTVADRLRAAEAEAELQRAALASEQSGLARQLRAAHRSGRQERLRLLLSRQAPEALGRRLVHYRYLNDARVANLDALSAGLARLAALSDQIVAERTRLDALAASNAALIEDLRAGQAERQRLVSALDAKLAEERDLLVALERQESDLSELLAELAEILADYPIDAESPMGELRGQLTWPVAGELAMQFGERRGRGLRSKGVVIATSAGSDVRAVYHGRVAYADWLPGMGMLLIVDHGDDLMSLYGYNETLLRDVGDWVSPGEVIATVGNSGGQASPGLYFELRRGSEPLNPQPWFGGSPGARR